MVEPKPYWDGVFDGVIGALLVSMIIVILFSFFKIFEGLSHI